MYKGKDPRCTITGNIANPLLGKLMTNAGLDKDVGYTGRTKQTWAELDNLYTALAEGFVEIGSRVQDSVSIIHAAGIEDTPELVSTIKGFSKDLELFTADLISIHKKHADKTGNIAGEDDLALSISVYTDYTSLNERFNAVVFPTMMTIMEFTAAAMEKYEAAKKAKEEADASAEDVVKLGQGELLA